MTLTVLGNRFNVGHLVITQGAHELPQDEVWYSLVRHMNGDWGDLDDFDRGENDVALDYGRRLMSRYSTRSGTVFWIITEHDRSATTILLPMEY